MPENAAGGQSPPHPGRAARVAWRAGWILLALVSMAVAYVALVVAGH